MRIFKLERAYGLKSCYERLQKADLFVVEEIAEKFGISTSGTRAKRAKGHLKAHRLNDTGQHLYSKPRQISLFKDIVPDRPKEAQYE
ncbi:hypothetical protein KA005_11360 [bacterium]|nr:hypothetical protein [bacterium]